MLLKSSYTKSYLLPSYTVLPCKQTIIFFWSIISYEWICMLFLDFFFLTIGNDGPGSFGPVFLHRVFQKEAMCKSASASLTRLWHCLVAFPSSSSVLWGGGEEVWGNHCLSQSKLLSQNITNQWLKVHWFLTVLGPGCQEPRHQTVGFLARALFLVFKQLSFHCISHGWEFIEDFRYRYGYR